MKFKGIFWLFIIAAFSHALPTFAVLSDFAVHNLMKTLILMIQAETLTNRISYVFYNIQM